MLGTLTAGLIVDAFGLISNNAGDVAEMWRLDEWVRERTDALDAAENSTAAIGKGTTNPDESIAFGTAVRAEISSLVFRFRDWHVRAKQDSCGVSDGVHWDLISACLSHLSMLRITMRCSFPYTSTFPDLVKVPRPRLTYSAKWWSRTHSNSPWRFQHDLLLLGRN